MACGMLRPQRMPVRTFMAVLMVWGCAAEDDTSPCEAAADHVGVCTGERPEVTACDSGLAEKILAMDCEEVAAAASGGGKSDGWCFYLGWGCGAVPDTSGRCTYVAHLGDFAWSGFWTGPLVNAETAVFTNGDFRTVYTDAEGTALFPGLACDGSIPYTFAIYAGLREVYRADLSPLRSVADNTYACWTDSGLPTRCVGYCNGCID